MATPNPVARRAAFLLAGLTGTPDEIAAALDTAGLLARPADRIPAPHPITVRRTGLGCEIDVHSLFAALLTELAADASDDDVELAEIRDADGGCRDRLLEKLINRLGGATIRMGATDAHRFAENVTIAAGPVLPVQRSAA